jgi:hypothetical protein
MNSGFDTERNVEPSLCEVEPSFWETAGEVPVFTKSWPSSTSQKLYETGKLANDGELGQLFLNHVRVVEKIDATDRNSVPKGRLIADILAGMAMSD